MASLGEFVTHIRQNILKVTMAELAELGGVNASLVSRIESGKVRRPSASTLQSLAKALDVQLWRLERLLPQDSANGCSEFRVAMTHSLWSAPLIPLLRENRNAPGLKIASYLYDEPQSDQASREDRRRAMRLRWYNADSAKPSDWIPPPAPFKRVPELAGADTKICTADQLIELLNSERVDCIVAASPVFKAYERNLRKCACILTAVGGCIALIVVNSNHPVIEWLNEEREAENSAKSVPRIARKAIGRIKNFLVGGIDGGWSYPANGDEDGEFSWEAEHIRPSKPSLYDWILAFAQYRQERDDAQHYKVQLLFPRRTIAERLAYKAHERMDRLSGLRACDGLDLIHPTLGRSQTDEVSDALSQSSVSTQFEGIYERLVTHAEQHGVAAYLAWEPQIHWLTKHFGDASKPGYGGSASHRHYTTPPGDMSERSGEFTIWTYDIIFRSRRGALDKWLGGDVVQQFLSGIENNIRLIVEARDENSVVVQQISEYLGMDPNACFHALKELNFGMMFYPEWLDEVRGRRDSH